MALLLRHERKIRWPGALLAVLSLSGWLYFGPILAAAQAFQKRGTSEGVPWATVLAWTLPAVWGTGLILSCLCLLKPRLRTASS